jgi:hypothetical protein
MLTGPPRARVRIQILALALALAMISGEPHAQTLTCETSGAYRHGFDHHGYLSTGR